VLPSEQFTIAGKEHVTFLVRIIEMAMKNDNYVVICDSFTDDEVSISKQIKINILLKLYYYYYSC
jgi:hypothetical protein